MIELVQAAKPEEVETAKRLMREYEASLGVSLCFQGFEKELAELPGKYAPPEGRLLLCYATAADSGQAVGCVAMRKLDDETCEMKRLYLRPDFRGEGTGRLLALAIIGEARRIGYKRMRLDTLPSMRAAIALYESLGFERVEAYCHNPVQGAIYMELRL